MTNSKPWMQLTLILAGIYNLLWGAIVVLFPIAFLNILGMPDVKYPELFQCIGMMIGVFGIAYLAAAKDPIKFWPIVLAGLVGRILGPLGFIYGWLWGNLPGSFGLTLITNDLIWIIPFSLILIAAKQRIINDYTS